MLNIYLELDDIDQIVYDRCHEMKVKWYELIPDVKMNPQAEEKLMAIEGAIAKAAANNAVKVVREALEDALENEAYYKHRLGRIEEIVEALKELANKGGGG